MRPITIHIFVVLFLASAGVGLWASYDPQAAFLKFCLIVAAIVLYAALASQPAQSLSGVWVLLGLFCLVLAIWLLWGQALGGQVRVQGFTRNQEAASSVLTILIPFAVGLIFQARSQPGKSAVALFLVGILASLTSLMALFLSAELNSWLGLIGAVLLWLTWGFVRRTRWNFKLGVSIAGILLVLLIAGIQSGVLRAVFTAGEAGTRILVWRATMRLALDFLFSGGGLNAFSGLYSEYMLVLPFAYLDNSHNLFLEVLIEQGIFGLLAFGVILAISGWMVIKGLEARDGLSPFRNVLFVALAVMIFQGMLDNSLYQSWDVAFLFLLPGLAVASRALDAISWFPVLKARWLPILVGGLILVSLVVFRRPLLAEFYANLGSVELARSDLADFPSETWRASASFSDSAPFFDLFQQALALDPYNRTANHRLGLVALQRRDFQSAVDYLEKAYRQDPGYRGIRKVLGYSYVWNGQDAQAVNQLERISEAKSELAAYQNWWKLQDRPDLASSAGHILSLLDES